VDSAGVVELIAYLEDGYAIQIPRSMLFDPGFTSVDGIAERVARLL
jgi:acyl carrier protein